MCGAIVPVLPVEPARAHRARWRVSDSYTEGAGTVRLGLTASPDVVEALRTRARQLGVPAASWMRRVILDALASQALAEAAAVVLDDVADAMAGGGS